MNWTTDIQSVTVHSHKTNIKESQTCNNEYLQCLCYVNQLYHLITLMTSQQDGLRGITKKLPPRDQFYTTSISQEDPKIWRGGRSDDRRAAKMLGEDRRRGIAVG